jgi:hypothetical protein
MSIESLPPSREPSIKNLPVAAGRELLRSAKNIVTVPPYASSKGMMDYAAVSAGHMASNVVTEALRLPLAGIGGIIRWTASSLQNVLGSTVKLGWEGVKRVPFLPTPSAETKLSTAA